MKTTAGTHGFVTRGIHWLSAIMIAYGYFKGLDSLRQLSTPGVLQTEIVLALALGAVFLVRLFWTRRVAGATRLPSDAPKWEHVASKLVHYGLYASVFAIVLTGLGIALGFSTPALSGVFLAAMLGLHDFALGVLPLLLVVHIAGALWHKVVRKDGVLESMTGRLPIWLSPTR